MLNELCVIPYSLSLPLTLSKSCYRVGWDFNFAFRGYGDLWREHRRDFHRFFNPVAVQQFRPHIIRGVKHTLLRMLENPEHFLEHFR